MRNFNFLLLLISLIVLFGACKSEQIQLKIINLNEAQGIRKYATVYTLPKTVVRVNVKVEKTTFKKGPYYQYANTYLGLSDIIEEDGQNFSISDVEFVTYPVADTNNIYLIETDELNSISLKLNKDGLLETINPDGLYTIDNSSGIENLIDWEKNTSIKNKVIEIDNITFDDVLLPKNLVLKKSTSEQASFLANQILTLRDDRAAILVGDGYTETMPAGDALKTMISSIDIALDKYMSMFVGKTKRDYFYYSFDYIPNETRKKTQSILFRFSENYGIVENTDVNGMPMIIEIESSENLKQYDQFNKRQIYLKRLTNRREKEEAKENGLFYRIPEVVDARLIVNDKVLRQKKIQLAQFGSIHSLPIKYLDGNYTIELYPELGSLKSILQKERISIEKKKNQGKNK